MRHIAKLQVFSVHQRIVLISIPGAPLEVRPCTIRSGATIDDAQGWFLDPRMHDSWQGREADYHHAHGELGGPGARVSDNQMSFWGERVMYAQSKMTTWLYDLSGLEPNAKRLMKPIVLKAGALYRRGESAHLAMRPSQSRSVTHIAPTVKTA